jgi:hypothetical protein
VFGWAGTVCGFRAPLHMGTTSQRLLVMQEEKCFQIEDTLAVLVRNLILNSINAKFRVFLIMQLLDWIRHNGLMFFIFMGGGWE